MTPQVSALVEFGAIFILVMALAAGILYIAFSGEDEE